MITGGAPYQYSPYGGVLLPLHHKERNSLTSSVSSSCVNTSWTSAETEMSRDLFKALKAINIRNDIPKEHWKLRHNNSGEEELYTSSNTVIWSRSDGNGVSHLIKTFTLENRVHDSVWCRFNDDLNGKVIQSVCAIDSANLEVFTNDGHHYPIALPFQVNKIYPSKYGLILERVPLSNESTETPLPIIFGLTHPLKEISPLILCPSISVKEQRLSFMTVNNKLELVTVIEECSLVVFYMSYEGIHCVYRLRNANIDELKWAKIYDNDESDNPLIDSFIPNNIHLSLPSTTQSSLSSPFRTLNTPKLSMIGMSSLSSPTGVNPSSRSTISSSMSSVLSPLKSSRLAASPASPLLRAFGSPAFQSNDPQTSKLQSNSRSANSLGGRFLSTPKKSKDYEIFSDIIDPIVPELTIEYLWNELAKSSNEKASKVFISTDLMGQSYLALLLCQQQYLKLIRLEQSNDGERIIFGTTNVIHAKDAEPITALNMIITLDSNNILTLYSGLYKTSIVHLPLSISSPSIQSLMSPSLPKPASLLSPPLRRVSLTTSSRPTSASGINPSFLSESRFLSPVLNESNESLDTTGSFNIPYQSIAKIISLQDPVDDRITIGSSESILYRFNLPPIATSTTVSLCLSALKNVLPRDSSMQLLIKWYSFRNAPGNNQFTNVTELNMFKSCILSLIGYDTDTLPIEVNTSQLGSPNRSPEVIKKIKLDNDESSDDDWNWLLSNKYVNSTFKKTPRIIPSVLFPYLPAILYSLHLVYEEMKLNTSLWECTEMIVDMLYLFSIDLKLVSFQDHYWRDFPIKCSPIFRHSAFSEHNMQNFSFPPYFKNVCPSIYSTLRLLITNDDVCIDPFPYIANVTKSTYNMIILFANSRRIEFIDRNRILFCVSSAKPNDDDINLCSINSDNPNEKLINLMNHLGITRNDLRLLPSGLAIPLWDAIFHCRHNPRNEWNADCYTLIGRPDLSEIQPKESRVWNKFEYNVNQNVDSDVDDDGITYMNNDILRLLFPNDQRISEAYSMLASSKPVKISIQQKPGVTDHDFIEEQERHLYTICIRTMALPLGRGMLTFRSYTPVVAETFPIPKLNLVGRVPPRNNTIDLSHIEVPPNMNTWPLFHNGVAAGLRVSPSASDVIDSTWIVYNRPKSSATLTSDSLNEHAGFLLALGLNGHLSCLSTMSIHDYLCKGNELTRVAVLLGLAAAKRGTMDVSAVKVLSIHIEALLPPTSTELDVPPIVQVAAVLGIGLLYQSSGQHHIAEVMLGEIGRPPGPEMEHYIDRESYALAAGLSFGLVTLGKGNDMISLVSSAEGMSMADQLCHYMLGGHKRPLTALQREKYKTPSYQIREGDCINADVTSPGATLALGMMFFNTNNEAVTRWVSAPDTQHLLEIVRPDFLMLRALCSGLIMWSKVEPSIKWVESHIPLIVMENAFQRSGDTNDRFDYETMSQAYCNIVAGTCFALGLKYAGSSNENAFKTLMNFTNKFINLTSKSSLAEQAGRSTIESCLNVLVVSLGMVMAGTGNIEVMRICRFLRSRLNQAYVLYGSHIAIHMSLGLLFLGGCRYTLSSSPESVAALICAFFPKFPIHSSDNRYHLQAFRHLYVLASEPRLVIPRDIDTKNVVYVHLYYRLKNSDSNEMLRLKAPCFLPELNRLEEVVVDDERYWRISFKRDINWKILELFLKTDGVLYVKQKTGSLPYSDDPKGFKSLYAQSIMKDAVRGWSFKSTAATEFSNDTIVTNFSKLLLSRCTTIEHESKIQQKFCSLLFECASNERVELIQLLMNLVNIANKENIDCESLALWQIKFAISMSERYNSIKSDFVDDVRSSVDKRKKHLLNDSMIINYLNGTVEPNEIPSSLSQAISFYDIPPYGSLSLLNGNVSLPEIVSLTHQYSIPISTCIILNKLLSKVFN